MVVTQTSLLYRVPAQHCGSDRVVLRLYQPSSHYAGGRDKCGLEYRSNAQRLSLKSRLPSYAQSVGSAIASPYLPTGSFQESSLCRCQSDQWSDRHDNHYLLPNHKKAGNPAIHRKHKYLLRHNFCEHQGLMNDIWKSLPSRYYAALFHFARASYAKIQFLRLLNNRSFAIFQTANLNQLPFSQSRKRIGIPTRLRHFWYFQTLRQPASHQTASLANQLIEGSLS